MAGKISSARLGVFIFIGLSILILSVFLIGEKSALFSTTFQVKTYFNDIQGLREGAIVRLSGIDVGSIDKISIASVDSGKVEVVLNLKNEIKNFLRIDTKASIESEGLVGNKFVSLKVSGKNTPIVQDGGTIQSENPIGFAEIILETQGILQYTKQMTKDLSEITTRVNNGEGTIGMLLNNEKLYNSAVGLTNQAEVSLKSITGEIDNMAGLFNDLGVGVNGVVKKIDGVIKNIDELVGGVRSGKGLLGTLLADGSAYDTLFVKVLKNVERITDDTKVAASRLAENMEALKHNWLFKSYYENRGYWETAEFENKLDSKLNEINSKLKQLDDRIEQLKKLEK